MPCGGGSNGATWRRLQRCHVAEVVTSHHQQVRAISALVNFSAGGADGTDLTSSRTARVIKDLHHQVMRRPLPHFHRVVDAIY